MASLASSGHFLYFLIKINIDVYFMFRHSVILRDKSQYLVLPPLVLVKIDEEGNLLFLCWTFSALWSKNSLGDGVILAL